MNEKNKKTKILIIEDETTHLDVIQSKLELEGFEIAIAVDGEEGERMIKKVKPDLILLDLILPKKNGFDILEGLQKEKTAPPVIVISNSGQPVEIERALNLGVKDYLIKANFSPQDVVDKVKKVLNLPPKERTASVSDVSQGQNQAQESSSEKTKASNGAPAILIIEDDKFLRELISQKLISEGFEVFPVIDGEGAFEYLQKAKPRLILLDLILPGIDGFEILRRLKEDQETSSIPVIVLSNLGQKEDIDRATELKAVDYLVKANFTPGEIIAKIKGVLQKKYI